MPSLADPGLHGPPDYGMPALMSPLMSMWRTGTACTDFHSHALPGPSLVLVGPRPYQARAWLRHWVCEHIPNTKYV